MKLLLDEHYADQIAIELRALAHDVVTVAESGLSGLDDEALLAHAALEWRALLSSNVRDFMTIITRWAASGQGHGGLLLTSDSSFPRAKGSVGRYVRVIRRLMDENPHQRAFANQVLWLSDS